jgi:two-component system, OmpR family, KDP operon response regulator KdpE
MPPPPLLLVVDDDPSIRQILSQELRAAGYGVLTAQDGAEALAIFHASPPDVVLTDLAMPRVDGFGLISAVRKESKTPILVLSVRGGESDKVRALDLGADDYVTKPFSLAELLARVRTHLRRTNTDEDVFDFDGLSIDVPRRRVVEGEREVRLTPTEFQILIVLARNAGRPVTVQQLSQRVWGGGASSDTVRVHVSSLRRKLEPDPSNARYLITEPWVGYRFIGERASG